MSGFVGWEKCGSDELPFMFYGCLLVVVVRGCQNMVEIMGCRSEPKHVHSPPPDSARRLISPPSCVARGICSCVHIGCITLRIGACNCEEYEKW